MRFAKLTFLSYVMLLCLLVFLTTRSFLLPFLCKCAHWRAFPQWESFAIALKVLRLWDLNAHLFYGIEADNEMDDVMEIEVSLCCCFTQSQKIVLIHKKLALWPDFCPVEFCRWLRL